MPERAARICMHQQVFCSARDRTNNLPAKCLNFNGNWPAQSGPTQHNFIDARTDQVRREAIAGGFYFRKFGHLQLLALMCLASQDKPEINLNV